MREHWERERATERRERERRIQQKAEAAANALDSQPHKDEGIERQGASAVSSTSCNSVTSSRLIKRLASCGLNVSDFSHEVLCERLGQKKIAFLASRNCPEISAMLVGSAE
jgi:hypothetical protein